MRGGAPSAAVTKKMAELVVGTSGADGGEKKLHGHTHNRRQRRSGWGARGGQRNWCVSCALCTVLLEFLTKFRFVRKSSAIFLFSLLARTQHTAHRCARRAAAVRALAIAMSFVAPGSPARAVSSTAAAAAASSAAAAPAAGGVLSRLSASARSAAGWLRRCGAPAPVPRTSRTVVAGGGGGDDDGGPPFADNSVTTSRYTLLNFLPLFLFEQFSRFANMYFLIICILQTIPSISITGGFPATAVPLAIGAVIYSGGGDGAREESCGPGAAESHWHRLRPPLPAFSSLFFCSHWL